MGSRPSRISQIQYVERLRKRKEDFSVKECRNRLSDGKNPIWHCMTISFCIRAFGFALIPPMRAYGKSHLVLFGTFFMRRTFGFALIPLICADLMRFRYILSLCSFLTPPTFFLFVCVSRKGRVLKINILRTPPGPWAQDTRHTRRHLGRNSMYILERT